ncbi:DUF1638 domain-containing protein [Methanosalsum natronophilum]|nr:DUF1638 domain-containing protein [Methanosalsum natronophilum]MCS3923274.1 hypothetical protein [Methanosalsum natronophilum]
MKNKSSTNIGIVLCKIFEDELIHIIQKGPLPKNILIIDNGEADNFTEKLDSQGLPYSKFKQKEIEPYLNQEETNGIVLIIHILELALHAHPNKLKESVYESINEMSSYCNGIFLLYGLCGNVLADVESEYNSSETAVKILRDDEGIIVDDCIAAVLGGRKEYLKTLKSCRGSGTFFLTPMWAANWRDMAKSAGMCADPYDDEMSKFVFEQVGYNTVGKIDTGLNYERDFHQKVEEFAKIFNFKIVDMNGSPKLIEKCYQEFLNNVVESD